MDNKQVLDWGMCIDCDWQGFLSECDIEGEYSEWHGRSFEYKICPECGGGIEKTNSINGDYYPDENHND